MDIVLNILFNELDDDNDNILNGIVPAIRQLNDAANVVNILEEEEETPVRNVNYYETIIPRYPPKDFFEHFRMSRITMQILIDEVGNRMEKQSVIPVEKKVLFAVWMLSKPESFLACCDRFNLAKSTGHLIYVDICKILRRMINDYIKWPNVNESHLIAEHFEQRTGFPGIIGAIDGCHVPIKCPQNNAVDYFNRKSFHSIVLQAVCDHRLKFLDVFIGMPGRVHDARVFRVSPLYDHINREDNPMISPQFHLIGDSAYPLMVNLLVPFKDNGHLTDEQTNFNSVLSGARSKIEQAFGRLKGKFRRLKYLDTNLEYASLTVSAACVLHNFLIQHEVDQNYENPPSGDEENIDDVVHRNLAEPLMRNAPTAAEKRSRIMRDIFQRAP